MALWSRDREGAARTGARILTDADLPEAAALCARDPVASALAASHVADAARVGLAASGGELWGFPTVGELSAVCWSGANLVPVLPGAPATAATTGTATGPDPSVLRAFAALALRRGRRASSVVGPEAAVLALWELLVDDWAAPREIRAGQPSMAITGAPRVEPDSRVRVCGVEEIGLLLPASVAMFTEEVGYSPVAGGGSAYAARVRSLLDQGRTFARIDRGEGPAGGADLRRTVVFKADLGAVTDHVAQVQGVWVDPAWRGRHLSEGGMAAVVVQTLRRVPCVSLYVNGYNDRAIAAYRTVGFERVGTYATVLF